MRRYGGLLFLLAFTFSLAGCTDADVIAIRIRLEKDFSGTVSTCSLLIPQEGGPLERGSSGIVWQNRVNLVCAAGAFPRFTQLRIEDISFSGGTTPDGLHYIQISLPRGPRARWCRALVPFGPTERQKVAAALDPDGQVKKMGSAVKLRFDLPGPVIGHGVSPSARDFEESADKARAELVIPLETALAPGDPIQWHLTW